MNNPTEESKPIGLIPRTMLMRKPPHGQPCTRCGACCAVTICEIGQKIFGDRPGPCPALQKDPNAEEGRFMCGVVANSTGIAAVAAKLLIGADDGCDARFNGEPADPNAYKKWNRLDALRADEIKIARALWGLAPKKAKEDRLNDLRSQKKEERHDR